MQLCSSSLHFCRWDSQDYKHTKSSCTHEISFSLVAYCLAIVYIFWRPILLYTKWRFPNPLTVLFNMIKKHLSTSRLPTRLTYLTSRCVLRWSYAYWALLKGTTNYKVDGLPNLFRLNLQRLISECLHSDRFIILLKYIFVKFYGM